MAQKKFKKGDVVRESGRTQTGVVVSFTKNEHQGKARFPGGLVKIKYTREHGGKMQGSYLVPAISVFKV